MHVELIFLLHKERSIPLKNQETTVSWQQLAAVYFHNTLVFWDGEGLHEIISAVTKPPNLIPQILFGCVLLSNTPEAKIIKPVPRFLQHKMLCCPWY